MPSVTITISLWWPVAVLAAAAWFFGVVGPIFRRLDERQERRLGNRTDAYKRWHRRSLLLFGVLAGPVYWVPCAFDTLRATLDSSGEEGSND